MSKTNTVFVLLGSNIEPRTEYIDAAIKLITERVGEITDSSSLYETEAVGFEADTDFYNKVICCVTKLNEDTILEMILEMEKELGRIRYGGGYTSRTIDIDILYFNHEIIDKKGLTIPHPRLHLRRFTLLPLCEIAPIYKHPLHRKTNIELLKECEDNSKVVKI